MIGPAMDRRGLKDSENAPNSIFPKINQTVFWQLGTEMASGLLFKHCCLLDGPNQRKNCHVGGNVSRFYVLEKNLSVVRKCKSLHKKQPPTIYGMKAVYIAAQSRVSFM